MKRKYTPNLAQGAAGANEQVSWSVNEWVAQVGICRGTYYTLEGPHAPRSVVIGRRRLIIEPPADYLLRMRQAQISDSAQVAHHPLDAALRGGVF